MWKTALRQTGTVACGITRVETQSVVFTGKIPQQHCPGRHTLQKLRDKRDRHSSLFITRCSPVRPNGRLNQQAGSPHTQPQARHSFRGCKLWWAQLQQPDLRSTRIHWLFWIAISCWKKQSREEETAASTYEVAAATSGSIKILAGHCRCHGS